MPPRSKYARPSANRVFTNRERPIALFNAARVQPAADQCHILVFYGIGGQGKTALCKKLRAILADDNPHRAVWGHLNLEEIPLREPARGLLQLRKTLRESGRIAFTAFDVAIATYWEKAYPTEDVGKALKDILNDSESVLGSIADNAPSWLELAKDLPAGLGLGVKALLFARKRYKTHSAKRAVEALHGLEMLDNTQLLDKLPYFFGVDLRAHREDADARQPVVFLDTYEALWSDKPDKAGLAAVETDAWVRELVAASPGVLFVVLGREKLSWDSSFPDEWDGYLDNQHRLNGLADGDAEEFLQLIPIHEAAIRRAMIAAAKAENSPPQACEIHLANAGQDESCAPSHAGFPDGTNPSNNPGAHPFYLDLAVDTYLDIRAEGHVPQPEDFGGTHAEILARFLRHRSQEERETLKLLAVPRTFDYALFAELVRHFGTHYPLTAYEEFTGFSFIEAGADGRCRLHALMREHLYAELGGRLQAELEQFLFGWFDARCQPPSPKDVTAAHELALREAVYHRDLQDAGEALDWFWARCGVFRDAARHALLEPLCRWALRLTEQRFGADHAETAGALNNLALLLQDTNRLAEAEPLMRRALDIDEASYGPEHPDVARDLNNLAQLLQATNRLAEAEPLMCRALAIDETSFGPTHPNIARDLNNLASLLQATNRLAEAETPMRRALAIDEASFGSAHPKVAIRLNNLAQLLQATNRLAEAEPLMRRVVEIFEKSHGPEHPNVATSLNNLAQLLKATNRLAEAETPMRRALAIDEASFGPAHPKVAIRLNNLALLLQDTNRLAEAEQPMRRALDIDEASFGPAHPNVARDLNNLARLLQDTDRLAEAEPLMRRALAIDEAGFGPAHPDVATNLNNLASLLQDTHRLAEAEPLMRRALAIDEASFGPAHPDVAIELNNLATLMYSTDRLAEAETPMRRALVILLKFTRATGHEHPYLRVAFGNYRQMLETLPLDASQIVQRLEAAGQEAGFDADGWRRLAEQISGGEAP